jgi:hypothetical protein
MISKRKAVEQPNISRPLIAMHAPTTRQGGPQHDIAISKGSDRRNRKIEAPWRSLLPSVQSKTLALVWLLNIGTIFQDYYGETPVGAPGIPAAVAALESVVKIVYPVNLLGPIRLLDFVRDAIPLGVDIRSDVMRHLSGCVAQAHAFVECRRAQPEWAAIFPFFGAPKSHVMPLTRAVTDRLLESQILLAAEKIKSAYRRFVVRAAENGIHHDADTASERDSIRRVPSCCRHRADDLRFRADKADIQGVARMPVTCVCNLLYAPQGSVMPEVRLPDPGNQQIRRDSPRHQQPENNSPPP